MVSYALLSELGTLPGEHPVEGSLLCLRRQVVDYTLPWSDDRASKLARLVDALCTPLLQAERNLEGLVLGYEGGFLVIVTHDALRLVVVMDKTGPEIDLLVRSSRDLLLRHSETILKQRGFVRSVIATPEPKPETARIATAPITLVAKTVEERPVHTVAVQAATPEPTPRPATAVARMRPLIPADEVVEKPTVAESPPPTPVQAAAAVVLRPIVESSPAATPSAVPMRSIQATRVESTASTIPVKSRQMAVKTLEWSVLNTHLISQLGKVMGQKQAADLVAREANALGVAQNAPLPYDQCGLVMQKVLGNVPNRSKRQALIHESNEFLSSHKS